MEQEKSAKLIPSKVIGFKLPTMNFDLNPNNTMNYALGLGFNEDQLNTKHFRFTYELSDEFSVFPTYSCVIPIKNLADLFMNCPAIPEFNMMTLLHGEEWLEIIKPLPTEGKLVYDMGFVDLEDKGKGTVFCVEVRIKGKEDGTLYSVIYVNLFVRGVKGEGAKSVGILKAGALKKVPKDTPFKETTLKTYPNQALYYRLGGNDLNPLHVDPDMSAMGGFEKPILHGLCFFGMTAKAAYEAFCEDSLDNMLSYKARFTSHVIPGETLAIKFWKSGKNSLIVSVSTVERKLQVLQGEFTFKNAKF
jgi:acyl dehydratase